MPRVICSFFIFALICSAVTGCATAPRPKTVGEVVGSVVDSTIAWTSMGVEKIFKK